jgi:hypothetical protein
MIIGFYNAPLVRWPNGPQPEGSVAAEGRFISYWRSRGTRKGRQQVGPKAGIEGGND